MNDKQGKLILSFDSNGGKTVWLLTQQQDIGVAVYSEKSAVTIGTVSHISRLIEHGQVFEGTVHLSGAAKNKIPETVKYTFKVDPVEESSRPSILL